MAQDMGRLLRGVGLGDGGTDDYQKRKSAEPCQVHEAILSSGDMNRRDGGHTGTGLQRIRGLAWFLDNSIPIPGTRIRIGLDALIGLIPGLGDAAGALFSSYILYEAGRLGVPRSTLLRMGANILIESLVGIIPLFGDLFDAGWKANQRNVLLLERALAAPGLARRKDQGFVAALVLAVGAVGVGFAVGTWLLLRWLLE
jgi:hypothetical protein